MMPFNIILISHCMAASILAAHSESDPLFSIKSRHSNRCLLTTLVFFRTFSRVLEHDARELARMANHTFLCRICFIVVDPVLTASVPLAEPEPFPAVSLITGLLAVTSALLTGSLAEFTALGPSVFAAVGPSVFPAVSRDRCVFAAALNKLLRAQNHLNPPRFLNLSEPFY